MWEIGEMGRSAQCRHHLPKIRAGHLGADPGDIPPHEDLVDWRRVDTAPVTSPVPVPYMAAGSMVPVEHAPPLNTGPRVSPPATPTSSPHVESAD